MSKAARIARFARRKGKAARDARPKDYILGGTLYNGGGWVAGNPRFADTRSAENREALSLEIGEWKLAAEEQAAEQEARDLEAIAFAEELERNQADEDERYDRLYAERLVLDAVRHDAYANEWEARFAEDYWASLPYDYQLLS